MLEVVSVIIKLTHEQQWKSVSGRERTKIILCKNSRNILDIQELGLAGLRNRQLSVISSLDVLSYLDLGYVAVSVLTMLNMASIGQFLAF